MLTGYLNMVENTNIGMVSVTASGHQYLILANSASGKVSYRIDFVETATTIPVTTQTWHEVKFRAGPSGLDGFWDGALLFHSDLGTTISAIQYGTEWMAAPCGFDDFSFLPVPASLTVAPESRNVEAAAGTTTFAINNGGTVSMPWSAEVIGGGDWLTITGPAGGTDSGTLTVSYTGNNDQVNSRTGTIRILASGAAGSPKDLVVVQAKSSISGDANGDGKVDVSDLGILAANYGLLSGAAWVQGDFNGDARVDVSDLGILAANYGYGTGGQPDFNTDARAAGLDITGEEPATENDRPLLPCVSVAVVLSGMMSLMIYLLGWRNDE
jgi:uncharacterized protein (DUF2141 family)